MKYDKRTSKVTVSLKERGTDKILLSLKWTLQFESRPRNWPIEILQIHLVSSIWICNSQIRNSNGLISFFSVYVLFSWVARERDKKSITQLWILYERNGTPPETPILIHKELHNFFIFSFEKNQQSTFELLLITLSSRERSA